MRGETRRKARRCIHRRSIAARIAAKTTGAAAQGAGVRPRPRAPRRTPEGAKRGFVSGRSRAEPFWARRIRQDRGPTAYMYTPSGRVDGEAARPERRARLPETKPHVDRQTSTAQQRCILKPQAQTKHTLPGRHAPGSMEKIKPGIAAVLPHLNRTSEFSQNALANRKGGN